MKRGRAERKPKGLVRKEPLAHSKVLGLRPGHGLLTPGLWLLTLVMAFCGAARAQEEGTTMLVRQWNPEAGTLTGWLPTHQIAMTFQLEGPIGDSQFDLNEAVTLNWVKDKRNTPDSTGVVGVSPDAREFEGQKWLPLMRDPNLVRIKKRLFLIRGIIFGGSRYKQATKARLVADSK